MPFVGLDRRAQTVAVDLTTKNRLKGMRLSLATGAEFALAWVISDATAANADRNPL